MPDIIRTKRRALPSCTGKAANCRAWLETEAELQMAEQY